MLFCFSLLTKWSGCQPAYRVGVWWESCRRCVSASMPEDALLSSLTSYLDKTCLEVSKNCQHRCRRLLKHITINNGNFTQSVKECSFTWASHASLVWCSHGILGNLADPVRNVLANFSGFGLDRKKSCLSTSWFVAVLAEGIACLLWRKMVTFETKIICNS